MNLNMVEKAMQAVPQHLLLALGDGDVDARLGEDVNQVRVIGQHHQRPPACKAKRQQPGMNVGAGAAW